MIVMISVMKLWMVMSVLMMEVTIYSYFIFIQTSEKTNYMYTFIKASKTKAFLTDSEVGKAEKAEEHTVRINFGNLSCPRL